MNVDFALSDEELDTLATRVALLLSAPPQQEWFTVQEAAEYVRCGVQRIYDLRSSGRLPKTGDGTRGLVRRADLDAYLTARRGRA